jgi:hypothetical protein
MTATEYPDTHETTFHVQVQRKKRFWRNGKWVTAVATKLTHEPPKQVGPDSVAIKLTVRIPNSAFEPFAPVAVLEIPQHMTQQPIEIIVEDPS